MKVAGSVSMSCVMVLASTNDLRFCGIRASWLLLAVWLGKGGFTSAAFRWAATGMTSLGSLTENGVISIGWMMFFIWIGVPSCDDPPWALMVVPCGIEAIRTRAPGSTVLGLSASCTRGMITHSP